MPQRRISLPLGGDLAGGVTTPVGSDDSSQQDETEEFFEPHIPPLQDLQVPSRVNPPGTKNVGIRDRLPSLPTELPSFRRDKDRHLRSVEQEVTIHQPQSGLYGSLWRLLGRRLYFRFGWQWLVRLSMRDRLRYALDDLWELRATRKAFAFVNSSGGSGKTTGATWYAAAAAHAFKGNVVLIDANENAGHTADRYRVGATQEDTQSGEQSPVQADSAGRQYLNGIGTIRLRDFVRRRHEFAGSHGRKAFLAEVDRHRQTGVFVIASNAIDDSDIHPDEIREALWVLKDNEQLVFADCGNGLKSPTNHGAVDSAEVLIFVGTTTKDDSLPDISSTMERYQNLGYADKIRSGFVVILGDKSRKQREYADRYGVTPEQVVIFPVDSYMKHTSNPIDLARLPLKVQVILFESLKAMIEA